MIILTSYGFESPIMAEKLSEYFTGDEKIMLIPFAGFNNESTVVREQKILENFGFKSENIFVCRKEVPLNCCSKPDWIYVVGGDPFKLLKEALETNIIPWITEMLESGVSYFGVSAGADFLCEDLSYLKVVEEDNYGLTDYTGIGIIKGTKILCHADQRDWGTKKSVIDFEPHKVPLFITNTEVYVMGQNQG